MSEFQYSGFISYRNGEKDPVTKALKMDLKNRFAVQLHEALQEEVSVLTAKSVAIDMEYINGSYFLKAKFSEILRESLCYIVIYTPDYFNMEKRFCTTEFIAIQQIITERNRILGCTIPTKSFIIPVILRGEKQIPKLLSDIAYFDFSNFDGSKRRIKINNDYMPKIRAIANYINELHINCLPHAAAMKTACETIELLDKDNDIAQIETFLEENELAYIPKKPWI
jgi:hypothetical protein